MEQIIIPEWLADYSKQRKQEPQKKKSVHFFN